MALSASSRAESPNSVTEARKAEASAEYAEILRAINSLGGKATAPEDSRQRRLNKAKTDNAIADLIKSGKLREADLAVACGKNSTRRVSGFEESSQLVMQIRQVIRLLGSWVTGVNR